VEWTQVFGNHDTWPGSFPLVEPWNTTNRDRIAQVAVLQGDWLQPTTLQTPSDIPVVLARINTVARSLQGEVRACGALNAVPPAERPTSQLLQELRDLFEPSEEIAVRIVVMHHPPHAFAARNFERLTTAAFSGARELADALSASRVQLVIAGHRHALDPPLGAEDYGFTQRPLSCPTVQLAAESPTQRMTEEIDDDLAVGSARSFCRYRLELDPDGTTFSVARTVFHYTVSGGGFRPGPEERTFAQIPLQ
jgi:hypothetical protein